MTKIFEYTIFKHVKRALVAPLLASSLLQANEPYWFKIIEEQDPTPQHIAFEASPKPTSSQKPTIEPSSEETLPLHQQAPSSPTNFQNSKFGLTFYGLPDVDLESVNSEEAKKPQKASENPPATKEQPTAQPLIPEPVIPPAAKPTQPPAAPPSTASTPPPAKPPAKGPQTFLIKFNNVKMPTVLTFISKITGKNFIFDDQDLDFFVTIVSSEPTTIENTIAALLQELRVRGLEMIEVGNNFIIHKNPTISSPAIVVKDGEPIPEKAQIITQVFRLKYVDPDQMTAIIRPMLSEKAIVESVPNTRHLIVTSLTENVKRIGELLASLDTPIAALEIGEYQARNIPIAQAISIVENLMKPIAQNIPFVLSAHNLKNVVYIASTPAVVEKAINLFKKIDEQEAILQTGLGTEGQAPTEEQGQQQPLGQARQGPAFVPQGPLGSVAATRFYIHRLQYQKGDQIQVALQQIAQSLQQSSIETSDLITTINTIQWIESSNALVFSGTEDSIIKVKELIDEIDTPLPQVLIEMLVLETTIDQSLNFGVDWGARFSQSDVAGADAFLSANSPINTVLGNPLTFSTLDPAPLANQVGFNLGVMGRNITFANGTFATLSGLVSALHSDANVHIVLNPKIVVEDNVPATIFVGINTSFQTQAIANDQGSIVTSNFEFRDVGSTLKVTPLIGNNGIITLDIEQEVSSVVNTNIGNQGSTASGGGGSNIQQATTAAQSPGPTTRKSKTTTRVHLPDKFFLILSGQISTEQRLNITQVPCLGGIPFLGALFTQRRDVEEKRNLMLFIRPQIINIQDIDPVTRRQQDIWTEKNREKNRWEYQVDKALDFFNVWYPFCDPERHYQNELH